MVISLHSHDIFNSYVMYMGLIPWNLFKQHTAWSIQTPKEGPKYTTEAESQSWSSSTAFHFAHRDIL